MISTTTERQTASIKKINDVLCTIDMENLYIYLGKDVHEQDSITKPVILVTHEFTRTGAPTVLLETGKILIERGKSVWCLCHKEGEPMRDFIEAGINVIIYEKYMSDDAWFFKAYKAFDLWFLNTLLLLDVYIKLNNTPKNVLWWLHEQEDYFAYYSEKLKANSPGLNTKILAAGPYVWKMIKKYMNIDSDIFNFGIEDTGIYSSKRDKESKVKFLQVGTIDGIKGQGILADAIRQLDNESLNKSEFVFCGNRDNADANELAKIDTLIKEFPNVKLIPQISREELYRIYDEMDAMVVASKCETTSAIIVESMMKGKISICSDTCGITHYMTNGKNGFIFKSENVDDLADKLTYVINNIHNLESVKLQGRKVYEEVYSKELLKRNTAALLSWADNNHTPLLHEPLVSVLISTYNKALELTYTLESVYKQTYKNIEVIIVDDASTDETLNILSANFADENNLFCIVNDAHLGKGESFNIAIDNCNGDYIAFLEAGDIWTPEKLEQQLEYIIADEHADGSYGVSQVFDNNKTKIYPKASTRESDFESSNIQFLMLRSKNFVNIGTVLLKRSALTKISGFRTDLDDNAPYEFMFRETGSLNMKRISNIIMTTINPPVSAKDLEDFIKANYYILIEQADTIKEYNMQKTFFDNTISQMDEAGAKEFFLQLVSDNENYSEFVTKKSKCYSEKQRIQGNILGVENCIGCGNCKNICSKGAISMIWNHKGFLEPVLNNEICINCGACVSTCPLCNNVQGTQHPEYCMAVQCSDDDRMQASSGGVFPAIAQAFVNLGGYVAGAVFDDDFSVKHIISNDIKDIEKMFGSKYLQSDLNNCFTKIKTLLDNRNLVLFTGTPCQNAALSAFLKKDYQNLYKIAVVCHGVPSPGVFKNYINELEHKNGKITEISFRKKDKLGWQSGFYCRYENDCENTETSAENTYMKLFLNDVILRDSCYECAYKDIAYCDILLGDFWSINAIVKIEDGKGTSYVSTLTAKGGELLEIIKNQTKRAQIIRNSLAINFNKSIETHVHKEKISDLFWNSYSSNNYIKETLTNLSLSEHFDIALCLMWSMNYGNSLTNYALYQAIEKLGKKVVAIDNMGTLFPENVFKTFAQKYYNCSSDYTITGYYDDVVRLADTFIVGSDQTWNYRSELYHGFGDYYKLDFVPDNKRKIAYGPSFGSSKDFKEPAKAKHLYERFDAIAVREAYGVDICKNQYNVNATLVADPVFLLTKQDYMELVHKSQLSLDSPFIVAYILNPNNEKIMLSNKIAESLGVNLINIIDAEKLHKPNNIKFYNYKNYLYAINPEDFLYYFANSEFVITDSFHGACFSMIFNKRFAAIKNRQSERFDTLKKFPGMSERIFDNTRDCNIDKVLEYTDFKSTNKELEQLRSESLQWIKNNI